MKFWDWLQEKIGIHGVGYRLTAIEGELAALRRKVIRKPKRFDQIERDRSNRQHPRRHHDIRPQAD